MKEFGVGEVAGAGTSSLSACHDVNRKKIMSSITLKIIQLCAGDLKHLPQEL